MPLPLTDAQQTAVFRATAPLDHLQQVAFLSALGHLLAGQQTIGDGELYRTLRELQKQNFEFPSEAEVRPPNHAAKTRRGYVK